MSEFDFENIKNKALKQLKAGKPLLGKDGAFASLLKSILNAALEGEMDAHLNDEERLSGNRCIKTSWVCTYPRMKVQTSGSAY